MTMPWRYFTKERRIEANVDFAGDEQYFIRFACTGDVWFKLFMFNDEGQTAHVEIFSQVCAY